MNTVTITRTDNYYIFNGLNRLGFNSLPKYYRSSHWASVRAKVFSSRERKCVICGSTKTLQLHHFKYDRLGLENEENDIIILCDKHHKLVHKVHKKFKDYNNSKSLLDCTRYVISGAKVKREEIFKISVMDENFSEAIRWMNGEI